MARRSPRPEQTADVGASRRAAARAELQRAQARAKRRGRLLAAGAAIVAVAIVAAAVVAIGLSSHSGGGAASSSASSAVISKVTGVPAATFDKVGAGGVTSRPSPLKAPALTADGKPRVLYVGAEYCPYCAAERWAVVAALSRFGTFSGLGQTHSATADVFPDTATLSFHGATYQSRYLSFTGKELQSNKVQGGSYAPLDTLSATDQKLLDTYDTSAHTGTQSGSIPFLDLGGRFVSAGASFSPQVLAGLTHEQIAAQLADPSSKVAQAVDGTANIFTAQLCTLTDQQPASVCSSAGVTAAAK